MFNSRHRHADQSSAKVADWDSTRMNNMIFPGTVRVRVDGYPNSITNFEILDLTCDDIPNVEKILPNKPFKNMFDNCMRGLLLTYLNEFNDVHESVVLSNPIGELFALQYRYYHYFCNKYPGCIFLATDMIEPIGIAVPTELPSGLKGNQIQGLVMPLSYSQLHLNPLWSGLDIVYSLCYYIIVKQILICRIVKEDKHGTVQRGSPVYG